MCEICVAIHVEEKINMGLIILWRMFPITAVACLFQAHEDCGLFSGIMTCVYVPFFNFLLFFNYFTPNFAHSPSIWFIRWLTASIVITFSSEFTA